ncbi:cytochrome c oxidase subunit II [Pseudogulbenkiania sp. MAI-1]|uniref:cytochrome c oxidase subunit II n=1 Tax=Pseudogulbenkiania sp. MAI-1 TaxID=990370 RepID=UPI00045E7CDE|nr:cytochrome c oxidase subunit II [Pseudogulbenkiania sp. MAI-1]
MALAIVLMALIAAAVLFHFLSPWWLTPLASNWKLIDDTLLITLVITGGVFIAINLFVAYCLLRFRQREGHRAAHDPENKKLEWWLTGLTSLGIVAMLAPGLFVYADLISPPPQAQVVEAVGQQWQWRFRFPGKDGVLGITDNRYISPDNPFGLAPNDPRGRDDVLIQSSEVHLPVDKPVKVLLRSQDVLHDFYVPQFRARMDLVPGMVTYFWFTPTRTGRFEILCAELCGVGHFNMRGHIVVEDEAAFQAWLAAQPTFTRAAVKTAAPAGADLAAQGKLLAQSRGCVACHSADGSPGVGPTWKDLYGKTETLADGSKVTVDPAYLAESIRTPNAKVVQGYQPIMPPASLNEAEMAAMLAYMKTLSGKNVAAAGQP